MQINQPARPIKRAMMVCGGNKRLRGGKHVFTLQTAQLITEP